MAWVTVMKSGTIFTADGSCIAGYAIIFGAMDCVSMYECMSCTFVCMCVCTIIVRMNVAVYVFMYIYIAGINVAMYACNLSDMTDTNF